MLTARLLSLRNLADARAALHRVGVEPARVPRLAGHMLDGTVALGGLSPPEARLLERAMRAVGGDAALPRDADEHAPYRADVLLVGTRAQLRSLVGHLGRQADPLPRIARRVEETLAWLEAPLPPIVTRTTTLSVADRTLVMGIVNVTPDSFADGGLYLQPEAAVAHAERLLAEGADIVDIGGESSRPGAVPVSEQDEMDRVLPVIEALAGRSRVPLSIDTMKARVAEAACTAGATMVNDVSGLTYDPEVAAVAAKHGAALVLTHMQGTPATMQTAPRYRDLLGEISAFFARQIDVARRAGVSDERVILDPGIGFGKTVAHNLEILDRLGEFRSFGRPLCVGPSRKSFLGRLTGTTPAEGLEATLAAVTAAVLRGAQIVRVHDVAAARRAVAIADAIARAPRAVAAAEV